MSDILQDIVTGLGGVVLAVVGEAVRRWLRQLTKSEWRQEVSLVIEQLVVAAEKNISGRSKGQERLKFVLGALKGIFPRLHEEEAKAMIEQAHQQEIANNEFWRSFTEWNTWRESKGLPPISEEP